MVSRLVLRDRAVDDACLVVFLEPGGAECGPGLEELRDECGAASASLFLDPLSVGDADDFLDLFWEKEEQLLRECAELLD